MLPVWPAVRACCLVLQYWTDLRHFRKACPNATYARAATCISKKVVTTDIVEVSVEL